MIALATAARPLALLPHLAAAARSGAKTVTRRLIRWPEGIRRDQVPRLDVASRWLLPDIGEGGGSNLFHVLTCPLGAPGQRLWVRERALVEALKLEGNHIGGRVLAVQVTYEADGERSSWMDWPARMTWRPRGGKCIPNGVHREGARTFLEVVAVRAERLQDITEEDARAEGLGALWDGGYEAFVFPAGTIAKTTKFYPTAVRAFRALWDSLAPAGARWADNPWVWRVGFRRIET